MRSKYNTKGKIILFLAFTGLSSALVMGFLLYEHRFYPSTMRNFADSVSAQARVLQFLDRAGWKPRGEKVVVEKVGDDLGLARAVLLKKSNEGMSVPGVLFMVGRQYILVGRLFDVQTGRDLSPELFGKVPITFDLSRLNLNNAHKRGSEHPKVVIVEYGDYGCQSCANLEKVWQVLLDNFPEVQHVYKHFPLSDGSRYLAEIAEAVSLHDQSKFWEIHQRFMSADKSNWDEKETRRFAQAPAQANWPRSRSNRASPKDRRPEQESQPGPSGISRCPKLPRLSLTVRCSVAMLSTANSKRLSKRNQKQRSDEHENLTPTMFDLLIGSRCDDARGIPRGDRFLPKHRRNKNHQSRRNHLKALVAPGLPKSCSLLPPDVAPVRKKQRSWSES